MSHKRAVGTFERHYVSDRADCDQAKQVKIAQGWGFAEPFNKCTYQLVGDTYARQVVVAFAARGGLLGVDAGCCFRKVFGEEVVIGYDYVKTCRVGLRYFVPA